MHYSRLILVLLAAHELVDVGKCGREEQRGSHRAGHSHLRVMSVEDITTVGTKTTRTVIVACRVVLPIVPTHGRFVLEK